MVGNHFDTPSNPTSLQDINKYLASKMMHEEVVDVCNAILKELNNRTWELRSFIDWEKFIQGV